SPLRWRGNIWLGGMRAWEEFDWIGHEVRIGSVRFIIREAIGRCLATSANPETGVRDIQTLALLKEGWGHTDFGVYGEVIEGGKLATGDEVVVEKRSR
ncbi:MAG: MOSC domain-containing protein, partial [Paracoccaceae bacterium]